MKRFLLMAVMIVLLCGGCGAKVGACKFGTCIQDTRPYIRGLQEIKPLPASKKRPLGLFNESPCGGYPNAGSVRCPLPGSEMPKRGRGGFKPSKDKETPVVPNIWPAWLGVPV